MNFLSLFVGIPVAMMLGLLVAANLKQIRTVMATGASLLLGLAVTTVIMYLGERTNGNTAEMLFQADMVWFAPLNIHYAVGCRRYFGGDVVVVGYHCVYGDFCFLADEYAAKRIFYVVLSAVDRRIRLLYIRRFVYDVYVL